MTPIRLATRRSQLAMAQAELVAERLRQVAGREVVLVPTISAGDRDARPLTTIGGTGVFVAAVREAVLDGSADIAVHSLKDLPTAPAPGLTLAAVPPRADVRDALVALTGPLAQLPPGATVGTGSPRRVAQLRALRPDLAVVELRGNVDSRIATVDRGEIGAVVLAAAGLHRLGRANRITQVFTTQEMLPAPGQGALAVEARAGDDEILAAVAALEDPDARAAVTAERSVLRSLEAGCSAPVGALATVAFDQILLDVGVFDLRGRSSARVSCSGLVADAAELGLQASRLLFEQGAGQLVGGSVR